MTDAEGRNESEVSNERIAARAYELYCEGGCEDGHDLEHWLRAEAELTELALGSRNPQKPESGAST